MNPNDVNNLNMSSYGWVNYGWVCPKCGRVYSPTMPCCYNCGGEQEQTRLLKEEKEKDPSLYEDAFRKLINTEMIKTIKISKASEE